MSSREHPIEVLQDDSDDESDVDSIGLISESSDDGSNEDEREVIELMRDDDEEPAAKIAAAVTPDRNSPELRYDSDSDDYEDAEEGPTEMPGVAPDGNNPALMSAQQLQDDLPPAAQGRMQDRPDDSARKRAAKKTNRPSGVIVEKGHSVGDVYWEVESICGYRPKSADNDEEEWLVSWVGYPKRTWELDSNLCDSAKQEAERYRTALEQKGKAGDNPIDILSSASDDDYSDDESEDDSDDDLGSMQGAERPHQQGKQKASRSSGTRSKERGGKKRKSSNNKKSSSSNWRKRVSRHRDPETNSPVLRFDDPFRTPDAKRQHTKELIQGTQAENRYFLAYLIGDRPQHSKILQCAMSANQIKDLEKELKKEKFPDGLEYTLFAAKDHGAKGDRQFLTKNEIEFVYVCTGGTCSRTGKTYTPWRLDETLERIANFSALPTTKVPARLELFLTPAKDEKSILRNLSASNFEVLKQEDSHMGCGFIPQDFLVRLFPTKKKETVAKIVALQVRIFAPRIGVAKGELVVKQGINKIQVPPSMIKVGPSLVCDDEWAIVVVKGTDPSNPNENLGKHLDPDSDSPCNSFREESKIKLSEMYQIVLCGLGVSEVLMENYVRRARSLQGLKHTHVMGVCDPTGLLPEGSVFITGHCANESGDRIHFSESLSEIFVSRSPCLDPTDGKLVPLASSKPPQMSQDTWEWLRNLPFGVIIFGKPRDRLNCAPLPMLIGDGDLDGDRYFIIWDKAILKSLGKTFRSPRMQAAIKKQEAEVRAQNINLNEGPLPPHKGPDNWLELAQERILQLGHLTCVGKARGHFYKKSHAVSKASAEGIWDTDARAFGRAFKDALDALKHGNPVKLPQRLQESTDKTLHQFITWT